VDRTAIVGDDEVVASDAYSRMMLAASDTTYSLQRRKWSGSRTIRLSSALYIDWVNASRWCARSDESHFNGLTLSTPHANALWPSTPKRYWRMRRSERDAGGQAPKRPFC